MQSNESVVIKIEWDKKYLWGMNPLNEDEIAFMAYWEQNRKKEKRILNQLLIGLPLGVLFGMPVLINLFAGWYKRATMEAYSEANPTVLLTAVVLIIVFVAVFSRRHKWEMKEQYYRELKARKSASDAELQS